MTKILLIDDERSFKDGRECVVAKSAEEAIDILEADGEWDEIWFDFVLLGSGSSGDVALYMARRVHNGNPVKVSGKCVLHASDWMSKGLLAHILEPAGYTTEKVEHFTFLER